MRIALRAWIMMLVLPAAVGCHVVEPYSAAKSPLAPLSVAPDAITLEVFSAPAPPNDPQLAELWSTVDEQPLPAELRRRLADNGMRAGIVGPGLPSELATALRITERSGSKDENQLASLNAEGAVTLRVVHVKARKRTELAIPHTRQEVSLLERLDGQVSGRTYREAECRLILRARPRSDGRVQLELTPELHHGEFKNQVRGSEAMWIWTQERAKRVFDELKLEPELAAGQFFLITCQTDRPGSAGHLFFTDAASSQSVPMLWAIRIARAAPDRAFYDGEPEQDLGAVSNDLKE